jgi:hypothetical protein
VEWTRAVAGAVGAALGTAVDAVPTWVLIVALLIVVGGPELRKLVTLVDDIAWRWCGRRSASTPSRTGTERPNSDLPEPQRQASRGSGSRGGSVARRKR